MIARAHPLFRHRRRRAFVPGHVRLPGRDSRQFFVTWHDNDWPVRLVSPLLVVPWWTWHPNELQTICG